mmetsp:Transcript_15848/g.60369  ORF Transcript_15848/g.60369 Transcript_15848/m.60369 type:complete len:82 (-) Transcript_15848:626-871(-)|eukprot:scaffold2660_cov257-Pinguiococcus_pyrenoidosus.AAC.4
MGSAPPNSATEADEEERVANSGVFRLHSPPTVEDKTGTPTVLIVPSFGKSSQKDLLFQGLTHWYYSSRAAIYGTRPGHTFD